MSPARRGWGGCWLSCRKAQIIGRPEAGYAVYDWSVFGMSDTQLPQCPVVALEFQVPLSAPRGQTWILSSPPTAPLVPGAPRFDNSQFIHTPQKYVVCVIHTPQVSGRIMRFFYLYVLQILPAAESGLGPSLEMGPRSNV